MGVVKHRQYDSEFNNRGSPMIYFIGVSPGIYPQNYRNCQKVVFVFCWLINFSNFLSPKCGIYINLFCYVY